ncbi:MAG: serine/threonine protein kinase [Planctomycetes bacterium]|nr:serine/threonine protein kinase [Planctomycetota bacterium]
MNGFDTGLARKLLAGGVLSEAALRDALQVVRRERDGSDVSLAVYLVQQRLIPADVLAKHVPHGAAPAPGAQAASLPGYEFLRELGRGGMGTVHKIRHLETGQTYAVKQLLPGGGSGEDRERFEREAQLLAKLSHPGLVRVHSAQFVGPTPYFVQELLAGGSLADRLREGPLAPSEAERITREIAEALGYLHREGVLHRDLKPANILFDDQGRARLTDFGLARRQGGLTLTQTGEILGTPDFMSPEQIVNSHGVDERSDLYSLGALLYAMLTGVPPIQRGNVFATLEAVLREAPRPPSEITPGVPPRLEAACLRALAKDRQERPLSAAEFMTSLSEGPLARHAVVRIARLGLVTSICLVGVGLVAAAILSSLGAPLAQPSPTSRSSPAALATPTESRTLEVELDPLLQPPASGRAWRRSHSVPPRLRPYFPHLFRISPHLEWVDLDFKLLSKLQSLSALELHQSNRKRKIDPSTRDGRAISWGYADRYPHKVFLLDKEERHRGYKRSTDAFLLLRFIRRDPDFFVEEIRAAQARSEDAFATELALAAQEAGIDQSGFLEGHPDQPRPEKPWARLLAWNKKVWLAPPTVLIGNKRFPGRWRTPTLRLRVLRILNFARKANPEWAKYCARVNGLLDGWPTESKLQATSEELGFRLTAGFAGLPPRGRSNQTDLRLRGSLEVARALHGYHNLGSAVATFHVLAGPSETLDQAQTWAVILGLIAFDSPTGAWGETRRAKELGRVLRWAGYEKAARAAFWLAGRSKPQLGASPKKLTQAEAWSRIEPLLRIARGIELETASPADLVARRR